MRNVQGILAIGQPVSAQVTDGSSRAGTGRIADNVGIPADEERRLVLRVGITGNEHARTQDRGTIRKHRPTS